MGFLDKFLNKFTNRASDKLADKAINKIFKSKDKKEENASQVQQAATAQAPASPQTVSNVQTVPVETVKVPVMDAEQMNAFAAMAGQSMAQANEVMKYLEFDDNMEVIGVKDDAPDYLKIAFKNGKFKNN